MGNQTVLFDELSNYKNGWVVGNFLPNLILSKEIEIAVMSFKKGFKSDKHYHLASKEWNIIVNGTCTVLSDGIKHKLKAGDIFIFERGVKTYVEYTSDTNLVVIKSPSIPGDKYWDKNEDDEG